MSVTVDYTAIAIITIFTSLCTSIGKEVAEALISYCKKKLTKISQVKGGEKD
jgi:hypothetical protein